MLQTQIWGGVQRAPRSQRPSSLAQVQLYFRSEGGGSLQKGRKLPEEQVVREDQEKCEGVPGGGSGQRGISRVQPSQQKRPGGKVVKGVCCQEHPPQHPLHLQRNNQCSDRTQILKRGC